MLEFERSERFDDRQKTALLYTSYLVWNPRAVEESLMRALKTHFSEEQIIELGYFVALTFGQQRWIKTLAIGHGEVSVPSVDGVAADEVPM